MARQLPGWRGALIDPPARSIGASEADARGRLRLPLSRADAGPCGSGSCHHLKRLLLDLTRQAWEPRGPCRLFHLLADRRLARHLEGEAEAGQIFARMIVRVSQLRQAVIVRPRLGALVDRRIEVNE